MAAEQREDGVNEREAMERRVTICRLSNNISLMAKKLAEDPEKVTELLPQLKALMRQLEAGRK